MRPYNEGCAEYAGLGYGGVPPTPGRPCSAPSSAAVETAALSGGKLLLPRTPMPCAGMSRKRIECFLEPVFRGPARVLCGGGDQGHPQMETQTPAAGLFQDSNFTGNPG